MRVVEHDPTSELGLAFADREDPAPGPHEALIDVGAMSLNFGEVAYVGQQEPGHVPGWDTAGVVAAAAADGNGPEVGARVLGFGWAGGWAERRAVDVDELAVVPDGVELAVAAALPVAGVTALRAVRSLGSIYGRTVLVTGAAGGVGQFAVQIAAASGARVIGAVGRPERAEGLAELGASAVVSGGLDGLEEPIDFVIDTVGGPLMADATMRMTPGGVVVSVGAASKELVTLDLEGLRVRGGLQVVAFMLGSGLGPDLALLLGEVAAGRLQVNVDRRIPWADFPQAAAALMNREISGKVVIELAG